MLASTRPTAACCRTATRLAATRPSSTSAAEEAARAAQQPSSSSATRKEWRIRRRVINAAVYGNREVEERLAGPSSSSASPNAGPSNSPRSSYLDQGFRPTPTRGLSSESFDRQQKTKRSGLRPGENPKQHRHHVARSALQRQLKRAARSFSTTISHSLQDDRLKSSSSSVAPNSSPYRGANGPQVSPPPFPSESFADDEAADVLGGVDAAGFADLSSRSPKGKGRTDDPPEFGALVPGCWIESRRNGIPIEGILCGRSDSNARELLILSPSANGESSFLGVSLDDVTFVLPSFTSPSEAAQCLTLPPRDPKIHALLQSLRHLEIRVEGQTRRLLNKGAKDLYRRWTSDKRTSSLSVNVSQALSALGESHNANPETHLAMHRILISDPLHFLADPISIRTRGSFFVRPLLTKESFERVRGWVREQSEELKTFAERAGRARAFGAKFGPPRYNPLATTLHNRGHIPSSLVWSSSDLEILRFLQRTLDDERALQVHPFMAIAPAIIKFADEATVAAGGQLPYLGLDVGRQRIRAFLAEVGVVAPWENWVVHDLDNFFGLWNRTDKMLLANAQEPTATRVEKAVEEAESSAPLPAESPAGSPAESPAVSRPPNPPRTIKSDYYASDAHDLVRHDFNALAVYTIDDAGAMELDDGISIAPAPPTASGSPGWWVHVHVADPTALLSPSHPLAKLALARDHSEYFPERIWSMLPEWFVQGEKMSLGSLEGGEQRTMSISMRVDEQGEVLESDVKVGIVRNVKRLTYNAVNRALGVAESPSPSAVLTHPLLPPDFDASAQPSNPGRQTDDSNLASDSSSISDLQTLHRLAAALLQRRVDSNALYWSFPSASVSVTPQLSHNYGIKPRPAFPQSSPLVTLTLPSLSTAAISPAQLLVSEMMVAANRAAAKFSVERGLPAPFRTQAAPVLSQSVLQQVLDCRDPRTGEASGQDILRLGVDFLPGSTSVDPGPHWPMGINDEYGYLKVTSPLRRYSDLFTHWQLKSTLLPSSTSPSTSHRFTRSAVLRHIAQFDLANKSRGRLSKHAEHFWSLYVLKHKLDSLAVSPEADPAAALLLRENPLSALSLRDPTFSTIDGIWVQPVLVQELGIRATLYCEKGAEAPEKGEVVNVRLEDIVLGPRSRMIVERRY
ncbi:hypothetical protein BCR35DRAFT_353101 [Leucosporidium creatinivorum]|uniref:RNB domain-containing protein n=1 Tax=Leucosporidium creatinivorum TaxID=106004 RepID=A0A1Y2F152_9BASI|nr:hypothetical protein BCR35DRAFT_353101 [Leucosporidium creatinivorum]